VNDVGISVGNVKKVGLSDGKADGGSEGLAVVGSTDGRAVVGVALGEAVCVDGRDDGLSDGREVG
jgi:hypothetical protein